ncbi:MAG: hypothetical protein ABIP68_06185, partial [Ferruginibacter sp.]
SLELNLNFPHLNLVLNLKGIVSIYQYISKQVAGWSKVQENLPTELINSKNEFIEVKNKIIELINVKIHYRLVNDWNELKRELENSNRYYFTYEAPELDFLIKVYTIFQILLLEPIISSLIKLKVL